MGCEVKNLGGTTVIVCGRGAKPKAHYCLDCIRDSKKVETSILCDFPAPTKSGTCDRPICEAHRQRVSSGVDYCTSHNAPKPAASSGELFE